MGVACVLSEACAEGDQLAFSPGMSRFFVKLHRGVELSESLPEWDGSHDQQEVQLQDAPGAA